MSYIRSRGGSVNTTIASLFSKAVSSVIETDSDPALKAESRPVVAGIAMSTKRIIGAEKSYANMVALANIEFDGCLSHRSIEELNAEGMPFTVEVPITFMLSSLCCSCNQCCFSPSYLYIFSS